MKDTAYKALDATEMLMEHIISERDKAQPNSSEKALLRHMGRHIDNARFELAKAIKCLEDYECEMSDYE